MAAGSRIEPAKKRRSAELVGLGLTYSEAGGAVGLSESSIDRIMRTPEYRKIAEETKRQRTSLAGTVASVVKDLLEAADDDGNPSHVLRKMGAELYAKNPTLLDAAMEEATDEILPAVVMRFPYQVGSPSPAPDDQGSPAPESPDDEAEGAA